MIKDYVLESYDYFNIGYDVAIESAIDTMKEKVGRVIDKIRQLILKLINWAKNIFKKKIDDIESKVRANNTPQIQRQFATDSFGAIFKSKEFLEKPVRSFIKVMYIQSDADGLKSKVATRNSSVEERIETINNIISKDYNSTEYVPINISKLKELHTTFDKFLGPTKNIIDDYSNDIELYSKHVTTMDEKTKSDLLLYYNLSISCLNSNIRLIMQNQKLINHILSSLK
jgi:uncharacterized protein YPO0396